MRNHNPIMPHPHLLEARPLAYNVTMPTRNTRKQYAEDAYYHIYSRGVNKQEVFVDALDYAYFLSLLKRYLSNKPETSDARVAYKHFTKEISLLAYCLMPNHIHMLIHQNEKDSIARFMQSLMTSYSMYFNKRHKRVGPIFQSRYLASLIDQDNYLHHISRYIHLNPKDWRTYEYTSLPYYMNDKKAEWLNPYPILELFNSDSQEYLSFVADYEDQKRLLDELKWELANDD